MEKIKFSVLVPVYNVENFIDECIQSVINQTYSNWEIVLVDDGSTDNSRMICEHYAKNYQSIRAYHKKNGGQLHTREYALKHATGDYCVFLDSDDTLRLDALEVISNIIGNFQCDCVMFNWNRIINDKIIAPVQENSVLVIADKGTLYKRCFTSAFYNSMCIKAVKTSTFRSVDYSKFYNLRHAEDLIQSIEVYKNCNKVVFIPDALYNYRLNAQSVTQSKNSSYYQVDFTVRQRVLDFIVNENVFTDEDFKDYRGACVNMLVDKIISIGLSDITSEKQKNLFQDIVSSSYYQSFINTGSYSNKYITKKRSYIYKLFSLNYRLLYPMFGVIKVYMKIRNRKCN